MGRPSIFTQELADKLCEWIADGKSLREFCERDDTPNKCTILKWLNEKPEFTAQYARAQILSADSNADDVGFIGDLVMAGHLDPAAARVAADCKKWAASKKLPKKYGDRVTHAGDAENPVVISRIELVAPVITSSTDKKDSDDSES